MSTFPVELPSTLPDNPEIQQLYESLLESMAGEDILNSCPMLGVQTQAQATSTTGSLRCDGISSLPSNYSRFTVDNNDISSHVETTVLDSSSPLDGIPLEYLLYAVVELTHDSLSPSDQHYAGHFAVVVSTEETSFSVFVEVQSDSNRLSIPNWRMLKLSLPSPGDMVRVIHGEDMGGAIGTCLSHPQDSQVSVKLDRSTSHMLFNINNLVRLDSSAFQSSTPSLSYTNPENDQRSIETGSHPPSSFPTTDWRVNSPVPSSPLDSLVSNSPNSSLIGMGGASGGGGNSPGNSWSISSSDLPDLAFCISSESSASSSNCSSSYLCPQPNTVQSLPLNNQHSVITNGFLKSASYNSLPVNHFQQTDNTSSDSTHLFADHTHQSQSSNLYPVLSGDNISSSSQSQTKTQVNGTNGGVAYPTLPPYSTPTSNLPQFGQTGYIALVNYPQQSQYTPVYCAPLYSQQLAYQTKSNLPSYQPSPFRNATPTNLYPQLQHLTANLSSQQEHSYSGPISRTHSYMTPTPKYVRSCMYPKLPTTKSSKIHLSPWEEFKRFLSSIPNCNRQNTLEGLIEKAITGISNNVPPDNWYNPLAQLDDDCCESDLSTESVRVSALCPLIKQRMEYPCRGLNCTHLQCFDVKAFLRLALKRRSQLVSKKGASPCSTSHHPDNGWKCPMCGKVVSISQLYIERYLQKAISTVDATELEFKGIGVWEPYEKCAQNNTAVIDLTMDSDEDM